jgi:PIN domain nuclease of toxin-antitoxin system
LNRIRYLFDTHALIFWVNKESVSEEFIRFFDRQERQGTLYVSSISFWEIAFLVKKGRLEMADIHAWKNDLLSNTNIRMLDPNAAEMIDSTLLPDHHKDPFDRLLIAQARSGGFRLVTKDRHIQAYDVQCFWM